MQNTDFKILPFSEKKDLFLYQFFINNLRNDFHIKTQKNMDIKYFFSG